MMNSSPKNLIKNFFCGNLKMTSAIVLNAVSLKDPDLFESVKPSPQIKQPEFLMVEDSLKKTIKEYPSRRDGNIKQFAISYNIPDLPDDAAHLDNLKMSPVVVLYREDSEKPGIFASPKPVHMSNRPQSVDDIFRDKNDFYKKTKKLYRANQERIVSDIICAIILKELRSETTDAHLVFFITEKFDTNKIIGRLAYLNLPMDRITILFLSRNISDFYTRNIVSLFGNTVDLNFLNEEHNIDKIFGPYPEDGSIGLVRTFYKTYVEMDLYPVRVDLFCQSVSRAGILDIKEKINTDYLSIDNTEPIEVTGIKKNNKTRLPKLLVQSETYAGKLEDNNQ
jgi:hypothetical protein